MLKIFVVTLVLSIALSETGEASEDPDYSQICTLPRERGDCRPFFSFKKYGYDSEKQTCVRFSYGGCGGNKNNFDSEEECQEACGNNN